jgi:hypothetical protein
MSLKITESKPKVCDTQSWLIFPRQSSYD